MLPQLESWLHDGESFMQRLRRYGACPTVKVLRQAWQLPCVSERFGLDLGARRHVFIREVEIQDRGQALLFARTAIPAKTLTGPERCLAHLGTRSLGSVLFSYPDIERSHFEVQSCHLPQYSSQPLWERQSAFYFRGKSLLLTETFLPRLVDVILAHAD